MVDRGNSNARGYGYKWRQYRELFLKKNPLCVYCLEDGSIAAANVVDHIVPHKGDMKLFWEVDNHQSLCHTHHSSTKQRMEKNANNGKGKFKSIGEDGWER